MSLNTSKWVAYIDEIFILKNERKHEFLQKRLFLWHLLIAGCDIGVQISVRPFVRPFVRPSTFTSKFGFLDINDSCESQTLHSNCP